MTVDGRKTSLLQTPRFSGFHRSLKEIQSHLIQLFQVLDLLGKYLVSGSTRHSIPSLCLNLSQDREIASVKVAHPLCVVKGLPCTELELCKYPTSTHKTVQFMSMWLRGWDLESAWVQIFAFEDNFLLSSSHDILLYHKATTFREVQ